MLVRAIVDVDLKARAQLARVLVECRLEPAGTQAAAAQPRRHDALHRGEQRARIESGAPSISSGRVVPRPSDNVVPSSITVPAYARAIERFGALGLGLTHERSPSGQP